MRVVYPRNRRASISGKIFFLTVRLLVARAGGGPSELLRLAAARVGYEEVAVVGHQEVLDLTLGGLVHVLLVKSDDGLSDSLADRIDLRRRMLLQRACSRRGEAGAVCLGWGSFE